MSAQVERVNVSGSERSQLFAAENFRNVGMEKVCLTSTECHVVGLGDHPELIDPREKSAAFGKLQEVRGKRHFSFSVDERHGINKQRRYSEKFGPGSLAFGFRRRGGRAGRFMDRGDRFVLPTKFLLGGSITDPLNLNSLCDEAINRSMNAATPMSSPLPVPNHRLEVRVMVPINSSDPLNLSAADVENTQTSALPEPSSLFRKRRKCGRKKRSAAARMAAKPVVELTPTEKILHIDVDAKLDERKAKDIGVTAVSDTKGMKRIIDHIVSPVIPQVSPRWKRRRTISESKPESKAENKTDSGSKVEQKTEEGEKAKSDRISAVRHKKRSTSAQQIGPRPAVKFRLSNEKFALGNYGANCISYGSSSDPRLGYFTREMFAGKDVLDVGCGAGHFTLTIARDLNARSAVGVDIDDAAIAAAKKNRQHYISSTMPQSAYFPMSFRMCLGPLAAPLLRHPDVFTENDGKFPNNVSFITGDYVPATEADVARETEQYDVVMAMSITKWIHLNNGDDGLKLSFRRMFRQLRPGGHLVLEAESWKSYRKKKKLTEKIFRTYQSIKFRPEEFRDYLLSAEVGFGSCSLLCSPSYRSKGLKNPILVFTKPTREPIIYFPHASLSQRDVQNFPATIDGPRLRYTPFTSSRTCTPDCNSSCCWMTPQFEFCSTTSCSTPCSTRCRNTPNFADDTLPQDSPFSSDSCQPSSPSPKGDRPSFVFGTESSSSNLVETTDPLDMILAVGRTLSTDNASELPDDLTEVVRIPQLLPLAESREFLAEIVEVEKNELSRPPTTDV